MSFQPLDDSLMDSLSQLEGDVVYEVGSFFGSGANMSQGEEFLPSINNDFIPRRNHVEKLKHVFPSGFGAAVHRQPATKLNDEKFEHFDMSASIESLPVKGKLPEKFSFVQWAQGGDEHMDSPEKGKDSYAGVSGQFRRVPSRFRDMGEGQRVNHIREMHLEVDNRHLLKYTTKDEGKGGNDDDIDVLVESLERDFAGVSRGGDGMSLLDEDAADSFAETLSLASHVSEVTLVPRTMMQLPTHSYTSLHVEIINLRAYIEAAFHSQGPSMTSSQLEGNSQGYVQAPGRGGVRVAPPDTIQIPLKLNFVQFKRQIVEMLRARHNLAEAKTSNIIVSYFDMNKQFWRDISKPLQWEQAKLVARVEDGVIRVGFSLGEGGEVSEGTPVKSRGGRRKGVARPHSRADEGSPVKFNAGTLDAGISVAEDSKSEMMAFVRLPQNQTKKPVKATSLRLAPRSFQLPSATGMTSTGGKTSRNAVAVEASTPKPMVDAQAQEEANARVAAMARSLETKLYRTRW